MRKYTTYNKILIICNDDILLNVENLIYRMNRAGIDLSKLKRLGVGNKVDFMLYSKILKTLTINEKYLINSDFEAYEWNIFILICYYVFMSNNIFDISHENIRDVLSTDDILLQVNKISSIYDADDLIESFFLSTG